MGNSPDNNSHRAQADKDSRVARYILVVVHNRDHKDRTAAVAVLPSEGQMALVQGQVDRADMLDGTLEPRTWAQPASR